MDFLRGHFTAEELGPEDLAAQRVYAALAADTKLGLIFGGAASPAARIYCRDFPPLVQPGMLHDLTVAPFAGADTSRPGFLTSAVTIYLTVRFLWPRDLAALIEEAGIATLGRHLTRVLRAPEHRLLHVPVGEALIPMASRGAEPGPASWKPFPVPGGDDAAVAVILPYDYEIPLDRETQRPLNIVNAGG